jgi:Zn-dependent protease
MASTNLSVIARELFDIVVMVAFLAYIFKDIIKPRGQQAMVNFIDQGKLNKAKSSWLTSDLWFTVAVVAPCIVLHELAHKFVALGFGYDAVFYAFYHQQFTLILGILAILSVTYNWGFILIVPGFVQIFDGPPPGINALIAFAGPAIHAAFYGASVLAQRNNWWMHTAQHRDFWHMTRKLNGFLFIFNMLPLPGIDGFKVYTSLFQLL